MLRQRLLVTLLLLPLGIVAILAGGFWFASLVILILGLATWEFADLFQAGGFRSSKMSLLVGVTAVVLTRYLSSFTHDYWLWPLIILSSMAIQIFRYERGNEQAGTEFAVTVSGIFYIGVLGSFFLLLRDLQHGEWWLLLTLPAVWLADSGAYLFGTRFGRNKMAPRLSPKKTWEGYFSGVLVSTLGTPLLLLLYKGLGLPSHAAFTVSNAALLGVTMGLLPTLGDLGISMFKRQMGVKDTGRLLPGHGGILDRIDSWLWALPIGYFIILWAFIP